MLVAIVAFIIALILTILATIVCAVCYVVCALLCLFGIIYGNTHIDACIEKWCQGLPREGDEEPRVDPQKPGEPGPVGGPLADGGGTVRSSPAIVLDDAAQLRRIDSWRFVLGGPSHVVLRVSGLTPEERLRWQAHINEQLSACGCTEGAAFMAIAVIGYAILIATSPTTYPLLQWSTVLTGLGIAVGAGFVGKVLGLLRARARLSALARQLEAATHRE